MILNVRHESSIKSPRSPFPVPRLAHSLSRFGIARIQEFLISTQIKGPEFTPTKMCMPPAALKKALYPLPPPPPPSQPARAAFRAAGGTRPYRDCGWRAPAWCGRSSCPPRRQNIETTPRSRSNLPAGPLSPPDQLWVRREKRENDKKTLPASNTFFGTVVLRIDAEACRQTCVAWSTSQTRRSLSLSAPPSPPSSASSSPLLSHLLSS